MKQILNEADLNNVHNINKDKLVLVLYKSNHCFPCRIMSKALDHTEQSLKRPDLIKFNYVDIDNDEGLSDKEKIEYTPTLVAYKNGEEIGRIERSVPIKTIKNFVSECIKEHNISL